MYKSLIALEAPRKCIFHHLASRVTSLTRGSGDGELAKIDLLQVKVAHGEKKAEEVFIHTT